MNHGAAALEVLRLNDLGDWTRPAPRLYPHQWSWDSAFIAIGLAHVDLDRALRELESLFAAQWADGRVPHIVFNPEGKEYFPGPDRWACAAICSVAPSTPATSGLVQPPVHALALAAAELGGVAAQVGLELKHARGPLDAPLDLVGWAALHAQAEGDVVEYGHVREDRVALEDH